MKYRGIVIGGSARAATLGYPTANIALKDTSISGVYAVRVSLEGTDYPGVAFADPLRGVLESHLFDFSGDLYGKEILVTLEKKLRDTKAFSSEEALQAAIDEDAERARDIL